MKIDDIHTYIDISGWLFENDKYDLLCFIRPKNVFQKNYLQIKCFKNSPKIIQFSRSWSGKLIAIRAIKRLQALTCTKHTRDILLTNHSRQWGLKENGELTTGTQHSLTRLITQPQFRKCTDHVQSASERERERQEPL